MGGRGWASIRECASNRQNTVLNWLGMLLLVNIRSPSPLLPLILYPRRNSFGEIFKNIYFWTRNGKWVNNWDNMVGSHHFQICTCKATLTVTSPSWGLWTIIKCKWYAVTRLRNAKYLTDLYWKMQSGAWHWLLVGLYRHGKSLVGKKISRGIEWWSLFRLFCNQMIY